MFLKLYLLLYIKGSLNRELQVCVEPKLDSNKTKPTFVMSQCSFQIPYKYIKQINLLLYTLKKYLNERNTTM